MAWKAAIQSVAPNMADTANVYANVAFYDDTIFDVDGTTPLIQFVRQLKFPVGFTKAQVVAAVQAEGQNARACYQSAQQLVTASQGQVVPIP